MNVARTTLETSFSETGFLPQKYWLTDVDIKCLAIEWGVSIFVVSTEAIDVTVLKYLSSVSAPGFVSIPLGDMSMSDTARGEAVVGDKDIVLIYNGKHYNALTWTLAHDADRESHQESHFNDTDWGDRDD